MPILGVSFKKSQMGLFSEEAPSPGEGKIKQGGKAHLGQDKVGRTHWRNFQQDKAGQMKLEDDAVSERHPMMDDKPLRSFLHVQGHEDDTKLNTILNDLRNKKEVTNEMQQIKDLVNEYNVHHRKKDKIKAENAEWKRSLSELEKKILDRLAPNFSDDPKAQKEEEPQSEYGPGENFVIATRNIARRVYSLEGHTEATKEQKERVIEALKRLEKIGIVESIEGLGQRWTMTRKGARRMSGRKLLMKKGWDLMWARMTGGDLFEDVEDQDEWQFE